MTPLPTDLADSPDSIHVLAKPAGARCNLRCDYCFFLEKQALYPEGDSHMTDSVLKAYVTQTVQAQRRPHVTLAWQGGEPTLMGLDFFHRALEAEAAAVPPGMAVERTLQTNGVLLDDEWAEFLADNRYLVGLSLDGPRELHDAFRHNSAGNSVFERVEAAARRLQRAGVEFNVLCTVNSANASKPLEVYRYFRDDLGARFLQFIPIVEAVASPAGAAPGMVTPRSVQPETFGSFLNSVFDEWLRYDVGDVFVQTFEAVVAAYAYGEPSLCTLRRTCGDSVVLEHNGDVYACDHFVDREHLLGNIMETDLGELVRSDRQRAFGRAKRDTLPRYCRSCEYLFACNGECPKNRILTTPDGEPGLNWLCEGLKAFYAHSRRPMQLMVELLGQGREAREVAALLAEESRNVGRNDACPCGSGRKYKHCCSQ